MKRAQKYGINFKIQYQKVPYADKFWRGENLAILTILIRNRQIKSTPKFFFFRHRQMKSTPNLVFFFHRQIKSTLNLIFFLPSPNQIHEKFNFFHTQKLSKAFFRSFSNQFFKRSYYGKIVKTVLNSYTVMLN